MATLMRGTLTPSTRAHRQFALLCIARTITLLIALFAGSWVTAADGEDSASTPAATERSIKAAYVYKFMTYVEWPETAFSAPDAPMVIGVISSDETASELAQITSSRTVNGRPIVIRRMRDSDSLAGVHVLFIGRAESARLGALLRSARDRPILTITETAGAIDAGAMINFVLVSGRVRFEIAADTAEKSGLKLSSRLLSVAQSVRTAP